MGVQCTFPFAEGQALTRPFFPVRPFGLCKALGFVSPWREAVRLGEVCYLRNTESTEAVRSCVRAVCGPCETPGHRADGGSVREGKGVWVLDAGSRCCRGQ